jgi:hypothetical protein
MDYSANIFEVLPVVRFMTGIAGKLAILPSGDTPPARPLAAIGAGIHAVVQKVCSLGSCGGKRKKNSNGTPDRQQALQTETSHYVKIPSGHINLTFIGSYGCHDPPYCLA